MFVYKLTDKPVETKDCDLNPAFSSPLKIEFVQFFMVLAVVVILSVYLLRLMIW